jgi:hypothetical protein
MNKTLKITLNLFVFLLIAGFGYYMIHSIMSDGRTALSGEGDAENGFVSPYKKINGFTAASDIIGFDISENMIYAALSGKVSVFDLSGRHQRDFAIPTEVCDILVADETIYLLYPRRIAFYGLDGKKLDEWEAHSNQSGFCAFTITKDYIFVTDAEQKLIYQYNKQGGIERFIKSPDGFIIPSYSFDIIHINDTIYCVNSGRHKIESYTLDGEFIASFGVSGAQAGAFAGCCNPAYLSATPNGDILTSEKGSPRISCYGRDGRFRTVLFNSRTLGGGTPAYRVKMQDDKFYIAGKKSLSVFEFDTELAAQSACAGCEIDCPLRKGL